MLHFRLEPDAVVDKNVYPNATRSSTISPRPIARRCKAFYDAGCRYLQFDDTAWAYLCSEVEMKKAQGPRR